MSPYYYLIPYYSQLAEAILSHPAADEDAASIYLEDTRSNLRFRAGDDGQDETRRLVDSDLEDPTHSRSASPEQEEVGSYPRIMINHETRVSQIDINVSSTQMSHDASPPHRLKKNLNGLSSQAGAILVSDSDSCPCQISSTSLGHS
jgi:solute carrier family 45 protein 1/2/4